MGCVMKVATSQTPAVEDFKPIPIRREAGTLGRMRFALCMSRDLQLLTCTRFLSPHLAGMNGAVLEVGCSEMPFRGLLPAGTKYTGLDVPQADGFGMRRHPEIEDFDGLHIPFADASFDHILCTEVLEHAEDPVVLVAEMHRVSRRGGTLLATVPFSARVHHAPYDYHRFTRFGLARMFAGLGAVEVSERGDDLAVIANKLIIVCLQIARPSRALVWRVLLLALAGPLLALPALRIAYLSLSCGWGSKSDPLGYGIRAQKV
jgi:SAM-dependent methyltransferase